MSNYVMIAAWVLAVLWPALIGYVLWRGVVRGRGPNAFVWIVILIVSVFWGLGCYAFLWEPETLVVRRVEVVSPTWKGPPLRIGVLSDTHMGSPHMSVNRLKGIVARLNAENPDIITLIGDYAGRKEPAAERSAGDRAAVLSGLPPLGQLHAPLGVWAVLGNHDWAFDGPAILAGLQAQHIGVLQNASARIDRPGGGAFWIGGLADYETKARLPSFTDTLALVPEDEPVVVMSHWPDAFAVTPERVSLVLAGHSHCGQVNLPYFGRLIHASEGAEKWQCGLYEERGRRLYVTAGVGTSIIPVRFRQPPEIAVITLRRE